MTEAAASVVTYMDLETLVRLSTVVVRGEVESIVSEADPAYREIRTQVTIRIEERLKGADGRERVTLSLPGGRVGDYSSVVFGEPTFHKGDRVVVFAQPTKAGPLTVTGLFQGKCRIEGAGGAEMVVRTESGEGAVVVGAPPAEAPRQPLAAFLERVRELVARYPAEKPGRAPGAVPAPGAGGVPLPAARRVLHAARPCPLV